MAARSDQMYVPCLVLLLLACCSTCKCDLPDDFILYRTTTSLNITWPYTNMENFTVKINNTICDSMSVTSCVADALDPGSKYIIRIRNATGHDIHNEEYYTIPEKPANLRKNDAVRTTNSIKVVWDEPGSGLHPEYLVEWSITGSTSLKNATVTSTSKSITDLEPGQMYTITVYTVSNNVKSEGVTATFNTIPEKPANLRENDAVRTTNSIEIVWDEPGSGLHPEYLVEWSITGSTSREKATVTSTSKKITDLEPGQMYTITVYTVSNNVKSQGVTATFNTNLYASSLSLINVTSTSLTISWSDPSGTEVSYYELYISPIEVNGSEKINCSSSIRNHIFTELVPGRTYNMTLVLYSTGGISNGTSMTCTTPPKAPSDIKLRKEGLFQYCVEATWTVPEENDKTVKYKIVLINVDHQSEHFNAKPAMNFRRRYCRLKPSTTYKVKMWAEAGTVNSTTDSYSNEIKTDISLVIVGCTSGVALLIVIVVIVVLATRHCRKSQSTDSRYQRQSTKVANFVSYTEEMSADAYCKLAVEYEHFKILEITQPFSYGNKPFNQGKNRFPGIVPNDNSRVVLLTAGQEEGLDYINASWMPGYSSKREYIVAQCPLLATFNDFWRMIWENNCQAIVMMTRTEESDIVKCDQYWPYDTELMFYGDLQVQIAKQIHHPNCEDPDYIMTFFTLTQGDDMRLVKHFQYVAWPPQGVPRNPKSVTNFVKIVRTHLTPEKPTVVHCSAGIGRSGVFVVLDRLLQTIVEHDTIDIAGVVKELWVHRPFIIQSVAQYIFIHLCLKYELQHRLVLQSEESFPTASPSQSTNDFEPMYVNSTEMCELPVIKPSGSE